VDENSSLPALTASLPASRWRARRARRTGALCASALDAYVTQGRLNVDALEWAHSQRRARTPRRDGIALKEAHLIRVERERLAGLARQAAQSQDTLAAQDAKPLLRARFSIGAVAMLAVVALGMTALPTAVPESQDLGKQTLAAPSKEVPAAAQAPATALATAAPRHSVLEHQRVVAIYGHPGAPVTGILGKYPPEGAALEALRLARLHEAASGLPAIGALHVTAGLAHPLPGSNGTYVEYLDAATLDEYVEAAQRHGLLLILDTQIGWGDPLDQARHFERYLREPFVHLALDPEFATRSSGLVPGTAIGTLDATPINAVQHYLAELVQQSTMPAKMLIVHQFRADMLRDAARIDSVPDVDLVIDMDGFGTPEDKLDGYNVFSLSAYADHPAIKLFFEWDAPMMPPAQLDALPVPPRLVIYQ
jgi:hypothetical protein